MCFLSALFKKSQAPEKTARPREADNKSVPQRPAPNHLSEIRHQAATGDPKLKNRHRSGSF